MNENYYNIKNSACSKVILIGEHSVVYNKPAIAIPLKNITCKVTITENKKNEIMIISELFKGNLNHLPEFLISLKTVIIETLKFLNVNKNNLIITIESDIPLERGMGSSASVSIAIIRSIFNYFNKTLTVEKTLELVNISEKIIHDNPSGIDATVITHEKPILFQKEKPFIPLNFSLNGYLIVADSGITGSTKDAIAIVKNLQDSNINTHTILMNKLEQLTYEMLEEINQINLKKIGNIMTITHQLLQQLNISTPLIDKFVEHSLLNGALGAKITGGGLGGCMIALVKEKEKALQLSEQLKKSGAKQVFINKI